MNTPFHFDLQVIIHPDLEQAIVVYGNMNITTPLLEAFFSLNGIVSRKVSFNLYVRAQEKLDWSVFGPKLNSFVTKATEGYVTELVFSCKEYPAYFEYTQDMHFIFEQHGDWLHCITPANTDFDLYGSDHGMYEHDIIKVPNIHQSILIQRILSKMQVEYFPLYDSTKEGFTIHVRKAQLGAIYGSVAGFVERFKTEVTENFDAFAKTQPEERVPAVLTWESVVVD